METEGKVRKCKDAVAWEAEKALSIEEVQVSPPKADEVRIKNQQIYQFIGISTFSEYTVVVCLLVCGVSTGYGSAVNTGKVESGSKCAAAGASRIIAVNINPDKFEISKTFGATEFVNPKDHSKPIQEVLRELTHGGVDFSIECVGNVGVMVTILQSEGRCESMYSCRGTLSYSEDILLGKSLKCSYFGGKVVPKLVQDYMSGKLLLDEFGTHRLTLDQVNQAFDLMITEKWSM
uniref:Zgc:63568 n=1 Tax=Cyprinus carpio TaxID=7962 RepID=A0A8C1PML2_CYPCA